MFNVLISVYICIYTSACSVWDPRCDAVVTLWWRSACNIFEMKHIHQDDPNVHEALLLFPECCCWPACMGGGCRPWGHKTWTRTEVQVQVRPDPVRFKSQQVKTKHLQWSQMSQCLKEYYLGEIRLFAFLSQGQNLAWLCWLFKPL